LLLLRIDNDIMVKAKDWSTYISEESKARENSPLKALANYLTIPGLISLGGGYSVSPSL
jgi:aromatic amino acid aminotransferase I